MQQPDLSNVGRYAGVGLTLSVSVGLFTWGGYLLDQRWEVLPLFTLLGVLLGFGGGMIHLLKVVAPELLPFTPKRPPSDQADAKNPDED